MLFVFDCIGTFYLLWSSLFHLGIQSGKVQIQVDTEGDLFFINKKW